MGGDISNKSVGNAPSPVTSAAQQAFAERMAAAFGKDKAAPSGDLKSAAVNQALHALFTKDFLERSDLYLEKLKVSPGPPKLDHSAGGLPAKTYAEKDHYAVPDIRVNDSPHSYTASSIPVTEGVFQDSGPAFMQDYWRDKDGHVNGGLPPQGVHGEKAGCAITTAANVMYEFGHFSTEEGGDLHMRVPLNLGGSQYALEDYYRMRGLSAQQYNGGGWSDLRACLDQGYAVVVTYSHESNVHTVRVTAMFTDDKGQEWIRLQDVDGGGPVLMRKERFVEQWGEVSMGGQGGLSTGLRQSYTLIGKPDAVLPRSPSVVAEMQASSSLTFLDGVHSFLIGFSYFGEGEILGGSARVLTGIIEGGLQAVPVAVQTVGACIEWAGRKPFEWAQGIVNDKDASGAAKFFAGILMFLAAIPYLLGRIIRELGQGIGALTAVFARMFSRPLRDLAEHGHSDNDAVNNVRYANPKGTFREQGYWHLLQEVPVVPGKVYLVNAMIHGDVSESEREMIVRVFASCTVAERKTLMDAIGAETVDAALAGTPQAKALAALMAAENTAPLKTTMQDAVDNVVMKIKAPIATGAGMRQDTVRPMKRMMEKLRPKAPATGETKKPESL